MALIVQKYGGTSVGSVERIKAVAERVKKTATDGNNVVVVVSAMGKSTDQLVNLAKEISDNPCRREMDMLLSTGEQVSIALLTMALQELGQNAISLTGAQVGIVTEAAHSKARILEIKTERIERYLLEGKVVVVAGFQGISNVDELEITTLGRGGSDTSAVALAAALKADFCEIYTDVDGIYTTDPRLVPEAQLMPEITCDEMLELASLGAKVLHPRSVEIARNYGVPLVVKSSWSDAPGTKVVSEMAQTCPVIGLELTKAVDGVEFDPQQAKLALLRIPDRPGIAASLFGEIARQNVDVDLIIQSIHEGNSNDIAFTVFTPMLSKAEAVTTAIAPVLGDYQTEVIVEKAIAKIAIAGAGIIGRPGIAAKMFQTLAQAQVNIQMISTSEVKLSCVIAQENGEKAIAAVCEAFELDSSPLKISRATHPVSSSQPTIPVRGVALDLNQARLAIRYVPDMVGMAGKIFNLLAEKNISVDMIIQSQRCRIINGNPCRDIAFTLPQADADSAKAVLEEIAPIIGCGEIALDKDIARVSIVGSGMIGYPGIAAKFFAALAQEKINIQMITTSEIKISCVVAKSDGVKALQVVHQAFDLGSSKTLEIPV